MRSRDQLLDRLDLYDEADFIYKDGIGYIAWHFSTGDNLEMLFIEVHEDQRGKGHATQLFRDMVKSIITEDRVPYHSVFGYRLASNKVAEVFYNTLGWTQVNLGRCIYSGDDTVLMWTTWENLLNKLGMSK